MLKANQSRKPVDLEVSDFVSVAHFAETQSRLNLCRNTINNIFAEWLSDACFAETRSSKNFLA
jgi:hypothetical protein